MLLDQSHALTPDQVVAVVNPTGDHRFVLVCEHASNWIPPNLAELGLDEIARSSHVAWDPGALGVAETMSRTLNAPLVVGCVSRLVYDCNRPPSAADAIPAVSETFAIPGNADLTDHHRSRRVETVYHPFRDRLESVMARASAGTTLVTIHSFTPVYHGRSRDVEIGILHGEDPRLAEAMLDTAGLFSDFRVRLNEPYGPADGVAHTLDVHGSRNGLRNVMVEIRNDLITGPEEQAEMADLVANWLQATISGREIQP